MFKDFELVDFENSAKKLEEIIKYNKQELAKLIKIENKAYDNFVKPYVELSYELEEFITPIFHIDSVKNSELTQKVYSECLPIISIYESELAQNEDIYQGFLEIDTTSLNKEQKKVVDNEIRDFKLGGCGLNDGDKEELKKIKLELSELSKDFSQNVLNATNSFEMVCEDFEDVKEIPKSDLELAQFEEEGKTKYKFSLQMPSYIAYMTYGTNRAKREEIYKAYTTRAEQNGAIIEKILKLRRKKAALLGFKNYADLSLASKMANKADEVVEFLNELALKAKDKAKLEIQEVEKLAKKDGVEDIKSFDLTYYSNKLKEEQYEINDEEYRPYFEKNSVLKGLFEFLNKIFDIEFKEVEAKTWDKKVKVYDIYEKDVLKARIFYDLEARADKRGGAWMNNWHSHFVDSSGNKNLASAYVVGNFPPSSEKTPSLLRHDDVVTLFHEMGHALHHLLSNVDELYVSGINGVAWDTVEFPSQFLEYFSYQKDVLKLFAKHYQSGEVLSDEMIDKLMRARNFQSSLATIRQVEFALFDFKLHMSEVEDEKEVQTLLDNIRDEISPILPPSYNKFQNGFSHIFAGGYAAGYYSYKWAEVLSADAFYLFIENGVFNQELALRYKELILGLGGSDDMDKLFYEFAKRNPKVESLLKIDGIID